MSPLNQYSYTTLDHCGHRARLPFKGDCVWRKRLSVSRAIPVPYAHLSIGQPRSAEPVLCQAISRNNQIGLPQPDLPPGPAKSDGFSGNFNLASERFLLNLFGPFFASKRRGIWWGRGCDRTADRLTVRRLYRANATITGVQVQSWPIVAERRSIRDLWHRSVARRKEAGTRASPSPARRQSGVCPADCFRQHASRRSDRDRIANAAIIRACPRRQDDAITAVFTPPSRPPLPDCLDPRHLHSRRQWQNSPFLGEGIALLPMPTI